MLENTAEVSRLSLVGDWSISGVAGQFPLLAQHVAHLSNPESPEESQTCFGHALPELDLSGITALDACGCQLLAHFSLALQQCGMFPLLRNMPDAFIPKIRILGFDRELNLSIND